MVKSKVKRLEEELANALQGQQEQWSSLCTDTNNSWGYGTVI